MSRNYTSAAVLPDLVATQVQFAAVSDWWVRHPVEADEIAACVRELRATGEPAAVTLAACLEATDHPRVVRDQGGRLVRVGLWRAGREWLDGRAMLAGGELS